MANERRLIDAIALRERMFSYYGCVNKQTCKHSYTGETLMSYEVADLIDDCIDNAPTVDAVEVVHGRWELYPSSMYRRCSVCKVEYERPKFNVRANYCPNCGAKMDGERKDNGRKLEASV